LEKILMITFARFTRYFLVLALVAGLAACSALGGAKVVKFTGTLSGAQEVPPVAKNGTGNVEAWLDTDTSLLKYKVTYSGLSGPAVAGHFHGPAIAGQNAGVVLGFSNANSPIEGEATLNAAQVADLLAGKWYVNIHTRAHPPGEIRAQVLQVN
jgi:CHRD domain